jgi:hypothetical protein
MLTIASPLWCAAAGPLLFRRDVFGSEHAQVGQRAQTLQAPARDEVNAEITCGA